MALEGVQLGQYRLVRLLGSGGMGEVYLAEDARIGQQVAIKVSRTDAASYPHGESAKDAARLFQREAKAIARLDHPRILPLFGYGEEHINGMTLTYIVMAYRPEGSFAQWLQQRDTAALLPVQDSIYFINQAAEALQYAHDNQVVHQDVKPANFLLRANKEHPSRPDLLLTDFGIARLSSTTASISYSIRGTPTYMAPEQWSGEAVYATDQYALAVLAYELLAGHAPFAGRQEQVMYQHIHVQVQPPSAFNPLLPTGVDTVMLQALAKQPEERFPSIAAFARALAQAAEGVDVSTAGTAPFTPHSGDLSATLAISRAEAETGANRTLTLPGGRRVSVSIPAHAYDGQILRLQGLGEPSYEGGSRGALILMLSVKETDATQLPPTSDNRDKTVPASNPNLIREAALPLSSSNSGRMASGAGVSSFASNAPEAQPPITSRRGVATGTAILLVGLALLVLIASLGFFYFQSVNRPVVTNTDATSTTLAQDATSLAVTATAQTNITTATGQSITPTATTPNTNPYPPPGATLVLNDSLSNNNNGYNWETQPDAGGACQFTGGAFQVNETQLTTTEYCPAYNTSFGGNFVYEVQMTIVQGDLGGLIIRDDTHQKSYYYRWRQDGSYNLVYYDTSPKPKGPLIAGQSSAFNTGYNQTNLIAVVVQGGNFQLYVNDHFVDSVSVGIYGQGYIGLFASDYGDPTEVVYSNVKVWTF
jgi:eukaryotic-like serine/threonine-protein kinase